MGVDAFRLRIWFLLPCFCSIIPSKSLYYKSVFPTIFDKNITSHILTLLSEKDDP